ncbi:MAG: ChaN family lipoprotein, partial [Candidatus Krumholzibacteria bacterium]|nr:ChaN family lipoprotein [Candidatus Krumholzibacteria bacterium]
MRKELLLVALPALMCCSGDVEYPPIKPQLMEALESHVKSKAQRPEDFIVSSYKNRNVVFLGETHRIRQNAELVQRMIPVLYVNGIYNLCTEFARREDQPLIDSLLTGDGWDEGLAREIAFRFSPMWGYREYIDIFKAAWKVNSGLSAGERRFRIFGLNDSPDSSPAVDNKDNGRGRFLASVEGGGGEEHWFRVLSSIIRVPGEKAIVYCGIYQALTEYK